MHRRRLTVLSVFLALAAIQPGVASSGEMIRANGHVEYFSVGPDGKAIRSSGLNQICPPLDIYDNQDPTFQFQSVAQNNAEWADDLHCSDAGRVVDFGIGFSGQASDSFDVTTGLYKWFGDNSAPGPAIVGPFTVRVPFNTIGVGFGFAPTAVVGPHLWVSASFSDPTTGLAYFDPPQVGISHNLYWNVTTARREQLSGVVANFVSRVTVCRLKSSAVRETGDGE